MRKLLGRLVVVQEEERHRIARDIHDHLGQQMTALKLRLNVMDSTAFSLCMDNNVPILVFDLNDEHAIRKAVLGEKIGTLVRN